MMPDTSKKSTRSPIGLRDQKSPFFSQVHERQPIACLGHERRGRLIVGPRRTVSAILGLVAALLLLGGTSATSDVTIQDDPKHAVSAPVETMRGGKTLEELLEELAGGAAAAHALIYGPDVPDAHVMSTTIPGLAEALDTIECEAVLLLDPLELPNLEPVDSGIVNIFVDPDTLEEYANTVLELAQDALAAHDSLSPPWRDFVIGTKVKTIAHLLPHYRQAAGLP
jgi:hypothetical protein